MSKRNQLAIKALLAAAWLAVAVVFMATHLSLSGAFLATILLLSKQAGAVLFTNI